MRSPSLARMFLCLAAGVLTACAQGSDAPDCGKQCSAGTTCHTGACRKLCDEPADCAARQTCSSDGVCLAAQVVVTTVKGNAPGDVSRVLDGLSVTGAGLAEASFALTTDTASTDLVVLSQSDGAAEILLPSGVRSGSYLLVASAGGESATAALSLQLPALTGDTLLSRLEEASTELVTSVLPTGSLAAGDHQHEGFAPTAHEHDYAALAHLHDEVYELTTDSPPSVAAGALDFRGDAAWRLGDGFAYLATAGPSLAHAAVSLPQGTHVTGLTCYASDLSVDFALGLVVKLRRQAWLGDPPQKDDLAQLLAFSTQDDDGGPSPVETGAGTVTEAGAEPVDRLTYTYVLEARLTGADGDALRFHGCRVTYGF